MPDVEGGASKEPKSSLSATANIFVPRAIPVPTRHTGGGGGGVPYPGTVTPGPTNPLQEIPAYMINCYPFVQEDGTRKSARWPLTNSGPFPGYCDQSPPGVTTGQHLRGQGRGKQPGLNQAYNVIPGGVPASFRFVTPAGGNPGRFPLATAPPASPQYCGSDYTRPPAFSPNHQWSHKINQGQRSWHKDGQRSGVVNDLSHGRSQQMMGGESDRRSFDRGKRERRNSGKIQGKRTSSKHGKKWSESERGNQTCPKTIILLDAAVQTDFEDSLAKLRLKEKPNSLYKNFPHRNKELSKGGDFSPSEEVDSDSGYSSPLHRRNMVSNGTEPLDPQQIETNSFVGTGNSETSQSTALQSRLSYAAVAQKAPVPRQLVSHALPTNDEEIKRSTKGKTKNRTVSKSDKGLSENIVASASGNKQRTRNDSKSETGLNGEEKQKKKRKRVKKRRKKGETTVESESAGGAKPSGQDDGQRDDVAMENVLHFEDEEEFPDLVSTNPSTRGSTSGFSPMSCEILKTSSLTMPGSPPKSGRSVSFLPYPLHLDDSDQEEVGKSESKTARKRRKRREKANKAAEDELAEITLEQHMLRELNLKRNQPQSALRQPQTLAQRLISSQPITVNKTVTPQEVVKEPAVEPKTKASMKKSQQPIAFDIGAMLEALEHKKPDKGNSKRSSSAPSTGKKSAPNVLDSNAPVVKRGKERENPKPKKPSPLKKVILKEREERKRSRIIGEDPMMASEMGDVPRAAVGVGVVTAESDLSQDGVDNSENESSRSTGVPIPKGPGGTDVGGTPGTSDLSPISQMSPISMTPLSSGVNSPIVGHVTKEGMQAALKIHSRRFREYCHQVLDKEIDACCTTLLQDLVRFQDRVYHKDPTKAKAKRRIVLGLREVTKHLRLHKIKCVIISPNLEKIQSKGGLDEALNKIIELCNEQNVPFVFALGRRALGRACAKLVPVSVAGIFNYEGSEANFQQLMDLTAVGRQAYKDMVSVLEREVIEHPVKVTSHIYAHMGHSRTPSACSAISFTSSVLSEPISENYPQSEPEVDSKGNEIIKDDDVGDENSGSLGNSKGEIIGDRKLDSKEGSGGHGRTSSRHVDDIDDGNEADTEDVDCGDKLGNDANDKLVADDADDYDEEEEDFEDDFDEDDNEEEAADAREATSTDDEVQDDVEELPHIDSFHASTHDLSAEILSQHSARTGDTVEGASTHSSKTVGDGSSTLATECLRQDQHGNLGPEMVKTSAPGGTEGVSGQGGGSQVKIVDRERIKTWVEQSQSCMKFHLADVGSTSESQPDAEENSSTDDLLDVDAKLNTHTVDTYL